MNKQTKQLILLVGLVVVAGIVAFFAFSDDSGSGAPPTTAKTATPAPTPAGTPAATTGARPVAGPGATPGAAPKAPEEDLKIPTETPYVPFRMEWPWEDGKDWTPNPAEGQLAAFDPLLVQNIDVVDPDRRKYIDQLKQEWVLDGIIETQQLVPIFGPDGKPELDAEGNPKTEVKLVLEAWFTGKRRPYRVKDRLTNTRFTIESIFKGRKYTSESGSDFKVRSGVDLLGDTGAKLTIFLADDERYDAGK